VPLRESGEGNASRCGRLERPSWSRIGKGPGPHFRRASEQDGRRPGAGSALRDGAGKNRWVRHEGTAVFAPGFFRVR